jgi:hypothetical protein
VRMPTSAWPKRERSSKVSAATVSASAASTSHRTARGR